MPAKITTTTPMPDSFSSQIALGNFGEAGAGLLFLDSAGKTFIGTTARTPSTAANRLKLVLVADDGRLHRLVEGAIKWPVRVAPKDHVVTFSNP